MSATHKADFETLQEGNTLRDTQTGETFVVNDIDREQATCAIHCTQLKPVYGKYVNMTDKQFSRCEVL